MVLWPSMRWSALVYWRLWLVQSLVVLDHSVITDLLLPECEAIAKGMHTFNRYAFPLLGLCHCQALSRLHIYRCRC
jgi:hypothetical protein